MDEVPVFEHQALESDMKTLANEVQKHRENTELSNANERELVKEAIRAFPQLKKVEQPVAPVPSAPVPSTTTNANSPLPDYAQTAPAEVKLEIEYLLDMAFHQGIEKALAQSEKSPYFVQDAFHDALAGRLYPELQKRGIVK